nr:restriction endonuclease [uncultured Lichenicoccus sp.]
MAAPLVPTEEVVRSEKIGRAIGLILFFGLLSGIGALAAFVTWRLRVRARAARAAALDASQDIIVTPTAAGSRPTRDRRALAHDVELPAEPLVAERAGIDMPPVMARTAPAAGALADYKTRCASMLRLAGWDASTKFPGGTREPDVIARRGTHLLALQCHLSPDPVDVQAVEDACLARERQRSDLAAIVSRSRYTEAARQLADRTGIVLLHDHELASFGA